MASDVCRKGHEWTPENTYVPPSGGRKCRECRRASCRRYRTTDRSREAGRKAQRRYSTTDKGRETIRHYQSSGRLELAQWRYRNSAAGVLRDIRSEAKRRGSR